MTPKCAPFFRHAFSPSQSSVLLAIVLFFTLIPRLVNATLQGQSEANRLRHAAAVSGLPSHFGKKASAVLKRSVVRPSQIWKPANLNPFIADMFADPSRLDWYVADVISTEHQQDLITINGGFSCLDLGESTSSPLTWWVSQTFEELTELKDEDGGAVIRPPGDVESSDELEFTVHDITTQCLAQRRADPSLRLVEHFGVHDGSGVSFRRFTKSQPPFFDSTDIFNEISRKRKGADRATPVVYHDKGIPIVFGLTFDSGFRIKAPNNLTTEKTNQRRVPITPLAAITYHTAARMQEEYVGEGAPRTNASLLTLGLLSAALPLLLALWIITNYISRTAYEHAMALRNLPLRKAIAGQDHWLTQDRGSLLLHIVAAAVLAAPLGHAIAEGQIDPRVYVETTQGITAFYGSSQENLSRDPSNPIAGAPFLITAWISYRELNPSYLLHFVLICVLLVFVGAIIVWRDVVKMNEIMPGHASSRRGFSLQKLFGRFKLWLKSSKGEREVFYTILITFRREYFETLRRDVKQNRHFLTAMLLLVNNQWRLKANLVDQDSEEQYSLGADLYERLTRETSELSWSFVCEMKLDNKTRFDAAMARLKWWSDASCPRQWEYIRRSLPECAALEQYHRRGQFPPDKALILLHLGLLDYLQYIDKVYVMSSRDQNGLCGEEDTNCLALISPPSSDLHMDSSFPLSEDSELGETIEFITFETRRDAPKIIRRWREGKVRVESVRINSQRFPYASEDSFRGLGQDAV